MFPRMVILGRGKLATAAWRIFRDGYQVTMLSKADFDAQSPESVGNCLRKLTPALVINTVVWGGIDACASDPAGAMRVNTLFPAHLARLSLELDFTLIHFSTDSVFSDIAGSSARVESSPALPPNIYGHTKFGADSLIAAIAQQYFIYRLPVVFGPTPKPTQFLERILQRLDAGETVRAATDVFSYPVYSLDVVSAIKEHLAGNAKPGLYHLVGADKTSLYDMALYAATLRGQTNKVSKTTSAAFQSVEYKNRNIHLSSEKIAPLRSWRESLPEFIKNSALV